MLGEFLNVPSQCRNCPMIAPMREEFRKNTLDVEKFTNNLEVTIESIEAIKPNTISPGDRENAFREAAAELQHAEDTKEQIQRNIDMLSQDCTGEATLTGKNSLGKTVVAHVCGSPFPRGDSTEPAHVRRPDVQRPKASNQK